MKYLNNEMISKYALYAYYMEIKNKRKIDWINILKRAFLKRIQFFVPRNQQLFLNGNPRSDYVVLFDKIYDSCEGDKGMIKLQSKVTFNLHVFADGVKYFHFYKEMSQKGLVAPNGASIKLNKFQSLAIYLVVLTNNNIRRQVDKSSLWDKCKTLTVLCDAWNVDNVVIDVANGYGINTVTAQHGLVRENRLTNNIDSLVIYKMSAKNLMCWGNTSAEIYKKFNPELNTFICGNPTLEIMDSRSEDAIGIIFDIPLFHEENLAMLKLAEKLAQEIKSFVKVRIHPQDSVEAYEINYETTRFNKEIENSNIIIGHTSSMIYQYRRLGKKVLRYKSMDLDINNDDSMQFANYTELRECISALNNCDFSEEAKKYIEFIGDEAVKKYRNAFEII